MKRKDDPNIKANHYTTAEQYIDPNDGLTKQFTIIDHDIKPKMSLPLTKEDHQKVKEDLEQYTKETIEEILALPAVNATRHDDPMIRSTLFNEFVTRTPQGVIWDEKTLRATCEIDMDILRDLKKRVWKNTVLQEYWFAEMSYEDILKGKWKKWAGLE